jgi:hypothetical protein
LATNFHVIANLPKLETYHHLYYGSTPNESAAQVNINSYTNFNSFSIDKILYSDTATVTTDDNVTGNPGNDMAIIDVNFGTNLSSSVKSKLDKLNTE